VTQTPPALAPTAVRRTWSEALTAAGLFSEALLVQPREDSGDLLRRAELAVLAGEGATALDCLADLGEAPDDARLRRLLIAAARSLTGVDALAEVREAAGEVGPTARASWLSAVVLAAGGDLDNAGPAAHLAHEAGCRDLRLLTVMAAAAALDGDDHEALDLVHEARRAALPDEHPAVLTTYLLTRAGHPEIAVQLAQAGASDRQLPRADRVAWLACARTAGAGPWLTLRRPLQALLELPEQQRAWAERRVRAEVLRDLTCRCWGSTGWIGPDRLHYVRHHLTELSDDPLPGVLPAGLLLCRATGIRFLDLAERQITLPVQAG
jgi:hypothetical protein